MAHPITIFFTLLLILLSATANATPTERRALVIGNANYTNLESLKNPVNDALSVADALRKLDFDVTLLTDASITDMQEGLASFTASLNSNTVSAVYYAGHGVQNNNINYLVPANADIQQSWQFESRTLSLDTVLAALNSSLSPLKILMLDACRDNPYKHNASLARSARTQGGLAQAQSSSGTIMSYATGPDKVAFDGEPGNRHSPYTQALLNHIQTPDIKVTDMFNRVGKQVQLETARQQIPWLNISPIDDFCFRGCRQLYDNDNLEQKVRKIAAAFNGADQQLLKEQLNLNPERAEKLYQLFDEYESLIVGTTEPIAPSDTNQFANTTLEIEKALTRSGKTVVPGDLWRKFELQLQKNDNSWSVSSVANGYLFADDGSTTADIFAPDIKLNTRSMIRHDQGEISVTTEIKDNSDIKSTKLFYRALGSDSPFYSTQLFRTTSDNHYAGSISSGNINTDSIEVYVEAQDLHGNLTQSPDSGTPLVVRIGEGQATSGSNTSRWIWAGVGVLLVGALTSLSGGDGGDDENKNPRPVTISVPLR